MTFVNLALLGGAAFIAVPIVLHLIMRRKPQHLEFPALRFIRQRESANKRRLQLRHLLLLACRCALIGLLALALARPSIRASGTFGDQEAPVAALLIVDTAPRMQYRQQNNSRLELAQQTALWLLPQLPADSEVAVFDSHSGFGAFSVDAAAARTRIEHLDTDAVSQPLPAVLVDALALLAQSEKPRKEIYVFTDLTRPSWSPSAAPSLAERLKAAPDVGVYVVDVGAHDPQNFGLAQIRLSAQSLTKNSPLRLQCDVVHSGAEGERTVELFLEEESPKPPSKRGQATLQFGKDQSQQAEFQLSGLTPGVHQGFLKLTGQDGLAIDDRAYFSVDVRPAWKVLLASPKKVADYTFALSEALAPDAFRARGAAAFDCETVSLDALAKQPLEDFAAVCLLDPSPLPAAAWQRLAAYASAGGGVAIFLGHNAVPVESFNEPAAQALLPAKLVRQWRAPDDSVYLAPGSLEHPMLANFKSVEGRIPWNALPVRRFWQLGELQDDAAVVAAYSNNRPAILEKAVGKGRVVTMTTPVSDAANDANAWNWLPNSDDSWPFVVLADGMFRYLVGSSENRLNYVAGQSALLHLPAGQPNATFSVTTPRGDQIRQSADEHQSLLAIAGTDALGNYRVRAGGGADQIDLGFSVNLPPEASQLDRASDADLKAIFGEHPFQIAHNRDEINRKVSLGRVGREIYPLLIVLMVLIMLVEQLLSNRFYGIKRPAPSTARTGSRLWRGETDKNPGRPAEEKTEPLAAPVP